MKEISDLSVVVAIANPIKINHFVLECVAEPMKFKELCARIGYDEAKWNKEKMKERQRKGKSNRNSEKCLWQRESFLILIEI